MKTYITLTLVWLLTIASYASETLLPTAVGVIGFSSQSSVLTTNTVFTNSVATFNYTYNTFHEIFSGVGTNSIIVTADKTLDNTNYISFQTNTLTASNTTPQAVEITLTGKWSAIRFRGNSTTTNATFQLISLQGQ